uniref:VWFA domain-containing protein n=1 Tax=Plectus sambesii TaxID=2011161 RepID=A0A914WTJ7_9BILA
MLFRFLYALCVFSATVSSCFAAVPLSQFFPYGSGAGDVFVPRSDDGSSPQVAISTPFYFFNFTHTNLWVNVNGAISFNAQISTFTPICGPVTAAYRMISPYWCDIDIRYGGSISYRQSTDPAVLQKASAEVSNAFPEFNGIQLTWAFVATYTDVPFFGSDSCANTNNNNAMNITDNFQVILATDQLHSFVIYYYNSIQWTTGTATGGNCLGLGGTPAKAGFDAGDGHSYYVIPGSCLSDIINIASKSNVGSPGKFVFRVDSANIVSADNSTGSHKNQPRQCSCTPKKMWLDIVLVLDSSEGVAQGSGINNALFDIIVPLTVNQDPTSSRIGIVAFNATTTIVTDLNVYNSNMDAAMGVMNMPYLGGPNSPTGLAQGLEEAKRMLLNARTSGNRKRNPQVVILASTVADGCLTKENQKDSSLPESVCVIANDMKENGVTIITVKYNFGDGLAYPLTISSPCSAFNNSNVDLEKDLGNSLCNANCFCPWGVDNNMQMWKMVKDPSGCRNTGECVYPLFTPASRLAAELTCQRTQNSYLADVFSGDKHTFLTALATGSNPPAIPYWIGLNDQTNSLNYTWTRPPPQSDVPAQQDDFTTWAPGFPLYNNADQACVLVDKFTSFAYKWKNAACFGPVAYPICQINACDTDNFCS